MVKPHLSGQLPISQAGAKAREQLLEAAGEVFAEKGFQGATSREICQRAGANLAAVNYHFGGFEAIYIATLKEAHRRVPWINSLVVEELAHLSPREKLRAFLRHMVEVLAQSPAHSWEMRLVSREMVIPTFAQAEFVATSIEPRRAFLKSIIGELLERPAEDPLVARCLLTLIAPCLMLSIINRATLESLIPDLRGPADCIKNLVDHIERFVLAGLDAVMLHNCRTVAPSKVDRDARYGLEDSSVTGAGNDNG